MRSKPPLLRVSPEMALLKTTAPASALAMFDKSAIDLRGNVGVETRIEILGVIGADVTDSSFSAW
jgi:hypothetical protein